MKKIETDITIIGAGPCGLFAVFEAGLLKMRCHLIDYLPVPGGQLSEIYPNKPIYDIPAYPEILAKDLITNLMKQIEPFHPGFTLGERVEQVVKDEKGLFLISTNRDTQIHSKIVVIAGGLGCFEPRKPELANLSQFEDKGIEYIIKDPEIYTNKRVVIAGGGDSALDWAIFLAKKCKTLSLVHRRSEFRGAPNSVSELEKLQKAGTIQVFVNAEISSIGGQNHLEYVEVQQADQTIQIPTDHFIPLFGLSPKLGPIAGWGLEIHKNAIEVNPLDYSTNISGIYAIGDINNYPGKLKLILCGFHEATIMMQSAYKLIHGGKKPSFKYTTVTGINELN